MDQFASQKPPYFDWALDGWKVALIVLLFLAVLFGTLFDPTWAGTPAAKRPGDERRYGRASARHRSRGHGGSGRRGDGTGGRGRTAVGESPRALRRPPMLPQPPARPFLLRSPPWGRMPWCPRQELPRSAGPGRPSAASKCVTSSSYRPTSTRCPCLQVRKALSASPPWTIEGCGLCRCRMCWLPANISSRCAKWTKTATFCRSRRPLLSSCWIAVNRARSRWQRP